MYTQANVKRQKTGREIVKTTDAVEFFPGIHRIEYKPDIPHNFEDGLYYRYYNASERIHGRTMEDWLRPTVFIGKAFAPYSGSYSKPWNDQTKTVENYKRSIRAYFEFCMKLGIKYWAGYDKDLVPDNDNFEELQNNLETVTDSILEYQQKLGIKPLWIGTDLVNSPRYANGACTNSDSSIMTYAGYQVKQALRMAKKLGSECFLFCPVQENYDSLLNTDLAKELKHFAKFMKLIHDHKERIGFNGQMLIQTVCNNSKNYGTTLYCKDFSSCACFLKHFNLDRYYKLSVQPGHEFHMANVYGMLASVDIKGEFLFDITNATFLMRTIVENGGMTSGGLTFYIPSHNKPFEAKELMENFISAIDTYAKALRIAVKLVNDTLLNKSIQMRYSSFSSGWGARLDSSEVTLEECEEQIKKQEVYPVSQISSHYDHCLIVLMRYIDATNK